MESLTESHDAQEMMASGNGSSEEEENNGSGESDGTSSFHSEMLGFNLALFPAHGTFQKLRESLSTIRDQLNDMWHMSTDPSFFSDIPDDFKNTTLQNEVVNGSLMTLNETVYKLIEDNGVQSVYHIQVISLHPNSVTDLTEQLSQQVSAETVFDVTATTEASLGDLSTTATLEASESS